MNLPKRFYVHTQLWLTDYHSLRFVDKEELISALSSFSELLAKNGHSADLNI